MAFPNITEFKEKLLDGGARPYLFRMELTWPAGVPLGASYGSPLIPFYCHVSEIPGTSFNPITLKYAGREVKYSGSRVYNNLSVTVINDEAFRTRRAFEAWADAMQTRETNISPLTSPLSHGATGYGGTGTVIQYDKQGNPLRSYVFTDMYPVSIGNIPLDWGNDSAIEDYTVEFHYQYWVPGDEYAGSVLRSIVT